MRFLICDDQDASRHMLQAVLQTSGHEVIGVTSGEEAVEFALRKPFDALLIELMLPGAMDGLDVIARLRSSESTRTLPIFAISAPDDPESRKRAQQIGSTAYYSKPLHPLEILQALDRLGRD